MEKCLLKNVEILQGGLFQPLNNFNAERGINLSVSPTQTVTWLPHNLTHQVTRSGKKTTEFCRFMKDVKKKISSKKE